MSEPEPPPFPTDKLVIIRFVGGPRDGQEERSDKLDDEGVPVEAYWPLIYGGEIGRAFNVVSPRVEEALKRREQDVRGEVYRYVVVYREETDAEIVITCENRQ